MDHNDFLRELIRPKVDIVWKEALRALDFGFLCYLRAADPVLQQEAQARIDALPDASRPRLKLVEEFHQKGLGGVQINLGALEDHYPSFPHLLQKIIEWKNLTLFNSVFDRDHVKALKRVFRAEGLWGLVDAVVDVAWCVGVKGEGWHIMSEGAHQSIPREMGADVDWMQLGAGLFNRLLDNSRDPHELLKVVFSLYVLNLKTQTRTEASRRLNISRTTLQGHLKLARQYGLPVNTIHTTH